MKPKESITIFRSTYHIESQSVVLYLSLEDNYPENLTCIRKKNPKLNILSMGLRESRKVLGM